MSKNECPEKNQRARRRISRSVENFENKKKVFIKYNRKIDTKQRAPVL